jgi:uncharacterized RDD family membrane protein YckC
MTYPPDPNQPHEPGQPPGRQPPPGQPSPGQQPQWQPPPGQAPGGPPPGGAQSFGPPPGQPQGPPPGQPPGQYPAAPQYQQQAQLDQRGYVLDYESGLYIPPGTELASHGRRIGAYFLAIPLFIVTLGIGYIVWGLILWTEGTSPALKVLGMRVWRVDTGEVPRFGRMALRDIVGRIVDGIVGIITEVISFTLFLTTARRQALHDMIASTTVLYDPNNLLAPPKQ